MIAAARAGRDGALRLRFARRGPRTVLAACRYSVPLQVLAPLALDDPAAVVSILNPTGGLLGGDRLEIDVEVEPGAHACLTTPSATKVYRSAGEPAVQHVRLAVAAGARVEWVPDHTIPHAGAALRQSIDVTLADDAALVLVDAFSAGRIARGEAWRFRSLDTTLTVRDARGWLLHDRAVLAGAGALDGCGYTEGQPYVATIVVVGEGLDAFEAALAARPLAGATAGVARLPRRGVLVRCLAAHAPALTEAVAAVWAAARSTVLGLPALALRKP